MMSVKTNPSRSAVSPIVIAIGAENIGPAVTAVKLAIFAAKRDRFSPDRAFQQRSAPLDKRRMNGRSAERLSVRFRYQISARSDFRRCQPPKDIER
jgi:hypothetical protein